VAIDLIMEHIRTKLGQHDFRKIYPNVYLIQSTFQVCSYFVYTKCSNNVQRQTTCEPNYKLTKFFWVPSSTTRGKMLLLLQHWDLQVTCYCSWRSQLDLHQVTKGQISNHCLGPNCSSSQSLRHSQRCEA
jgi:hypothetical protein